jgi:hypothetical protein
LRDAARGFHAHVVALLGRGASGRTENHDAVAQRRAFHAGDVGEDFAAQARVAVIGDGDDVKDRSAAGDVIAGLLQAGLQAGLQVGGQGGCTGLRCGRWRTGKRILRQDSPAAWALSVAAHRHLALKLRRKPDKR